VSGGTPVWIDRLLAASSAVVVGLSLAACSPDDAAPSAAEPAAETEAGNGAGNRAETGVGAAAEDCDCRRTVKTPLENPIKPADKATAD
jgi:hypothetical protein